MYVPVYREIKVLGTFVELIKKPFIIKSSFMYRDKYLMSTIENTV